jgi:hypothetical protein
MENHFSLQCGRILEIVIVYVSALFEQDYIVCMQKIQLVSDSIDMMN